MQNSAERESFENDHVETTKDKYLLTFKPLMSGGKKGT